VAKQASEVARGDDLLAKVVTLEQDALRIATTAEAANDLRTALVGVRELTRIIELMAKLQGELDEKTTVNVLVTSPEWLALRDRIIAALAPHPQARTAVLAALESPHAELN
jgi:hypothetical protein